MKKKYFILLMLIVTTCSFANAVVRYVKPTGTSGDGLTWGTAYVGGAGLRSAITAAVADVDQVWVAAGTYYNPNQTTYFTLKTGVTVYGGFSGTELESEFNLRNFITNVTTLSGDRDGTPGLSAGDAYHVVWNNEAVASGTLDGFIITGGNAIGAVNNQKSGGGIYNNVATATFRNCTVTGNYALVNAAGVYAMGLPGAGAGLIIDNCTISNNSAAGAGGACYSNASKILISNSTVTGNTTGSTGGVMYVFGNATIDVNNCVFDSNLANAPAGNNGGGFLFGPGGTTAATQTVTFNNSKFINNSGDVNNTATTGSGGAIYFATSAVSTINANFTNCLFSGNKARTAGAIGIGGTSHPTINSTYRFVNCTIANNSASTQTGGLFNNSINSSIITFDNCIIWGNTCDNPTNVKQLYSNATGGSTTLTYTCISNATKDIVGSTINKTAASNKYTNPRFVNVTSDFRITGNSPCVGTGSDAIYDAITPTPPITDIHAPGLPRKNGTIDMGAYEYTSPTDQATFAGDWTGAISTDWNVAGNWSGNAVPVSDAIINDVSNDPEISAAVTCDRLTIETGKLTIAPTGTLNVNKFLVNNAGNTGFVIESNATNAGSLIHSFEGVPATVNRWYTGGVWHQISFPVSSTIGADFLVDNASISTNAAARALTIYDTPNSAWGTYYTNAEATATISSKGYLMRTDADGIVVFKGSPFVGSKNIGLSILGDRWNMVGNPYASAIKLNANAGANNWLASTNTDILDVDHLAAYVWTGATYEVVNAATTNAAFIYAQSGQGFFVKAAATGTPSLVFSANMQAHANATTLKSAVADYPEIKLLAKNGENVAKTSLKFVEGSTIGMDPGYDAGLFNPGAGIALFTRIPDSQTRFMLQCLGSYQGLAMPIGIDYKEGGTVVFSSETINLPTECKVILEDKQTRIFTDLALGSYTATIAANTASSDRFVLHTSALSTGNHKIQIENLSAYVNKTEMVVNGPVSDQAQVSLFDLQGRLILQKKLEGGNSHAIGLPSANKGVYMLVVKDLGKTKSFKLLVK